MIRIVASLALFGCLVMGSTTVAEAQGYSFDANRTYRIWSAPNGILSSPEWAMMTPQQRSAAMGRGNAGSPHHGYHGHSGYYPRSRPVYNVNNYHYTPRHTYGQYYYVPSYPRCYAPNYYGGNYGF